MKTIEIYMQKGGVGKTTTTATLAYELAKHGKTLVVDADQQGNLTQLLTDDFDSTTDKDFLAVLKGVTSLKDALIECRTSDDNGSFKGLDIIGTKHNDARLRYFFDGEFRDDISCIPQMIEQARNLGYEFLMFDLPPSFGYYEKLLLASADVVIPIIEPEDFAIEGLSDFNKNLRLVKNQYNGKFGKPKYLICNKKNTKKMIHRFWCDKLQDSPYEIFEFIDSVAVPNATGSHVVLQEYQESNAICKSIERLVEKLINEDSE